MNRPDSTRVYRVAVLSVVKHDYLPRALHAHPRCEIVVVADDPSVPGWIHQRNEIYAREIKAPYVRSVQRAIAEHDVQIAVVSSEAERHCDLSVRAIEAGLHVVQDKPMSTRLSECDRVVRAAERKKVKFLLWNRNFLPALLQARDALESGSIGQVRAIHVDFYFSKDAGPPKGSRKPEDPPINWLQRQIEAHVDGSDGGVGTEAMGELQIEGIYPLAYIRMLTGKEVRRVFARIATHFHQANVDNHVDDLATVSLEMEDQVLGSICLGRIGEASHPDIGEIKPHVVGSQGALVISESRPEVGVYYRGQPSNEFRHIRVGNQNDGLLVEDFLQAIESDGDTILDARGGRAICATVQAALDSSHSGKPINVRQF